MDQGFWLFFIFQLVAMGPLSERMNLAGFRRKALLAGIAASLGAALCLLLLNYAGIDSGRTALKWITLVLMVVSMAATAGSLVLPAELSKKKA